MMPLRELGSNLGSSHILCSRRQTCWFIGRCNSHCFVCADGNLELLTCRSAMTRNNTSNLHGMSQIVLITYMDLSFQPHRPISVSQSTPVISQILIFDQLRRRE